VRWSFRDSSLHSWQYPSGDRSAAWSALMLGRWRGHGPSDRPARGSTGRRSCGSGREAMTR
jgi:hypothetical protein